jgi:hypothetical protein
VGMSDVNMHTQFYLENVEEKRNEHLEVLSVDGIIVKWTLKRCKRFWT